MDLVVICVCVSVLMMCLDNTLFVIHVLQSFYVRQKLEKQFL